MNDQIRILAFGDVVGKAGKAALRREIRRLKETHRADLVVVNGENSAGGLGIDGQSFADLRSYGADVITLGDHAFDKPGSGTLLAENTEVMVRPANFPPGAPGVGYTIIRRGELPAVAVVNLLGRVFINRSLDCPFRCMQELLDGPLLHIPIVMVDFHAEATSEKGAFGHHFDGKLSLIWGTHTHVQTNDYRILPKGTGFITDLGMCGPLHSVIGMDADRAAQRIITGLPSSYTGASGDALVNGIFVTLSSAGLTESILPLRETVRL